MNPDGHANSWSTFNYQFAHTRVVPGRVSLIAKEMTARGSGVNRRQGFAWKLSFAILAAVAIAAEIEEIVGDWEDLQFRYHYPSD